MSDSHAIPRAATARAKVRKMKPPKPPWRPSPRPWPVVVALTGDVLGYIWSLRHGHWLLVVACVVGSFLSLDEAVRWWRWRQWSAWSGEPVRWQAKWVTVGDWAIYGGFFALVLLLWLAEWIQP